MTTVQARPDAQKPCRCEWSKCRDHDLLLSIESDFDAMASVVSSILTWDEMCHGDNCQTASSCPPSHEDEEAIHPLEFPSFAAQHNWHEPVVAHAILQDITELYLRARRDDELDRLREDIAGLSVRVHELLRRLEQVERGRQ